MNTFRIKAYAKINLGLDVLRRRPDGYHEVKMIMPLPMQHMDNYTPNPPLPYPRS